MFHPSFYPQASPQSAGFNPMNFFHPSQAFFHRSSAAPTFNRSSHNLNMTHDFERFQMPVHGFTSIPAGGSMPFRVFDFNKPNSSPIDPQRHHQRWRQNMRRTPQQQQQQKQRRTPAFHFQDHSTSYFMTEPIRTSDDRIAVKDRSIGRSSMFVLIFR